MKIFKQLSKKIICSLRLGDGWLNKTKLLFVFIKFPLLRRLRINFKPVKLKLRKFGRSFYFYATDGSDLSILQEIFINGEYEIKVVNEPKIIFDLGSNVGLSVLFFKLKYPAAKIYAFEPDPETFKKMVKNTDQFSDIYCYNFAVSEKDGQQKFFITLTVVCHRL
jgi:hypothetical protein